MRYSIGKPSLGDVFLLLLPMTPVVQYIIENKNLLTPFGITIILGFFLLFSCLYVFLFPIVIGNAKAARTLMILGLAFAFIIIIMPMLSAKYSWLEWGSLKIQLPVFGGVFLITWLLYFLNFKQVVFFLFSFLFISNTALHFISQKTETNMAASTPGTQILSLVTEKKPFQTPNIYLLVYDAYLPSEILQSYGIDNSLQESYLTERGFNIYPQIYSIGPLTADSMSRVFEISSELTGDIRKGISGDGVVQRALRELGYGTYGLFPTDYFFRGINSSYNYSIPELVTPTYMQIISGILIGEFRFDLNLSEFTHEQFVEEKFLILNDIYDEHVFVYMHTDLPSHSQNSGKCLPNETELYKERLIRANVEMKQDVNLIMELDPDALIIVAGDHGPYLTKNCAKTEKGDYDISEISRLDIQDRYGSFLAIKWPTTDYEAYDEITVLQDLFPAIFAYLYKDESILEVRVEPVTILNSAISSAFVDDGIIRGGINDGEPLYLSDFLE